MSVAPICVVGGSGFIGSAVCDELRECVVAVKPVKAPRLGPVPASEVGAYSASHPTVVRDLATEFAGSRAVINAAGVSSATSTDADSLLGANAALPKVLAAACVLAGVPRFVHVSSAAVQGSRSRLDSSEEREPFSAYSWSKAAGEVQVLGVPELASIVYRPAGVHAADRGITRWMARIARSTFAVVARPPRPTPQALLANVASAIAFLATEAAVPPRITTHPSEGLTTDRLLELLGGKAPRTIPLAVAQGVVAGARQCGTLSPAVAGHARRLEMMLLGQDQADSWLTAAGWQPPQNHEAWADLGRLLAGRDPMVERGHRIHDHRA